jgi:hypothetical protein
MNGEAATISNNTRQSSYSFPIVTVTGEETLFTTAGNALAASVGVGAVNACWTAIIARAEAASTKRAMIAGYTGSPISCIKHAVDGYSLMGA